MTELDIPGLVFLCERLDDINKTPTYRGLHNTVYKLHQQDHRWGWHDLDDINDEISRVLAHAQIIKEFDELSPKYVVVMFNDHNPPIHPIYDFIIFLSEQRGIPWYYPKDFIKLANDRY